MALSETESLRGKSIDPFKNQLTGASLPRFKASDLLFLSEDAVAANGIFYAVNTIKNSVDLDPQASIKSLGGVMLFAGIAAMIRGTEIGIRWFQKQEPTPEIRR